MEESQLRPTGLITTRGKEFGYRFLPNTMIVVEYIGGGQVPDKLKSRFTSHSEAIKAIRGYLKR